MTRPLGLLALVAACRLSAFEAPPQRPTYGGLDNPTGPDGAPLPSCAEVPDEAERILGTRCASCHGPGSPAYADFGDALDPEALVADGWVVPGDPDTSPIMVSIAGRTMPPTSGGGPLSDLETLTVQQWIACGAESWGTVASTRGFLSPEMVFQAAEVDVVRLPIDDASEPDQQNARYLSLIALYNAGVPADRIALYTTALTKLVWSLTTERNVPKLVPVQLDGLLVDDDTEVRVADELGDQLLFRVDLRDFGWDNAGQPVDTWEELVKAYPFGIRYDGELEPAADVVAYTGSRVPIVHGDWFVANASVPPLYFDVLDVPTTLDAFLLEFGGIADFRADFTENEVDCAGMDEANTPVSEQNRVICRHYAIPSYCWQAFDFASAGGDDNVFAHPTEFLTAADGSEAFCGLFSGQQVYATFDAAGNRLDDAPIALVANYNPDSGGVVRTGLHCMQCHDAGVLLRDDQVRAVVLADPTLYDELVVDQVLEWYPEPAVWADQQDGDIAEFTASLAEIPVALGEEPIWALAEDYDAPLSAVRVAAELGLPEGDLLARLETDDAIQLQYTTLYSSGTVTRDVFELAARDTICSLEAGDPCDVAAFCGSSSAPCPAGSVCDALGQCSRLESSR